MLLSNSKTFTLFKCKKIQGIQEALLVMDYGQTCHTGEHATFMILGFICLFLYVLGIPFLIFLLLWWNKEALHDTSKPRHQLIKSALGGLYTQYEPSYWWFEIFLLFNKTMMCGGLVMAAPGTPLQVLIAILIMQCHLLVTLKMAPYVSDGEDMSAFLSSLTLTLTTVVGLVLMQDSPDTAGNQSFDADVLAFLLIGIAVFCIVSQICITIMIDCGLWERIRSNYKLRGKNNVSKKRVTPVTPVLSIADANKEAAQKAWEIVDQE